MIDLPLHAETHVSVRAPPAAVFSHLDDHRRLSAHMTRRTWMTFGSRMTLEVDAADGRAVGSHIRLYGHILGIRLHLEEVVTEREPPARKVWETIGEPRLLVIGSYRMGFEIAPDAAGSDLVVFIDYDRPAGGPGRLLSALFGPAYARWCTQRMANDAAAHFGRAAVG